MSGMKVVSTIVTAQEGLYAAGIAVGPRGAGKSNHKMLIAHGDRIWDNCGQLVVRCRADGTVRCRYGRIAAAMICDYGTFTIVKFILAYGFDHSRIGQRSVLHIKDEEEA